MKIFYFQDPSWTEYSSDQSGVTQIDVVVATTDEGYAEVAIDDITLEDVACNDDGVDVTTEANGEDEIAVQGNAR